MAKPNILPEEVIQRLKKEGYNVGPNDYIDKGSTASVYKAKSGNKVFAVKVIDLSKQTPLVRDKYLPREISIVGSLNHEFIMKTHRIIQIEKKFILIVSDFADGGDLITLMEKTQDLGLKKAKEWFSQIVSAMVYLHSKGIAHRDIKADNILIHQNKAKLTDFGFARISTDSKGNVLKCTSMCGTLEYESPEAMFSAKDSYDPILSDCFSLGVLLFSMITLKFPFDCGPEIRTPNGRIKLKDDVINQKWALPHNLKNNEHLYSLLKQLLNPDVHSRIRSCQILPHPFFKNNFNSSKII